MCVRCGDPSGLDGVCSSHSLEHFWLDDLATLLEHVAGALAPDGMFVAEVPLGSLLRHALYYQHDPHTVFFTYDALDHMLRGAGFRSVAMTCSNTGQLRPRKDAVYHPRLWEELDGMGSIVAIATKLDQDDRLRDFA